MRGPSGRHAPAQEDFLTDPTARLPGRHLTYRPALDGLRGLAVLAVVAFHFDALPGGYLGVDLFFVLSGFLITSLLLGEMVTQRTVDLKAFWSRRARRLLPALFLLIAAGAAYAWLLAAPAELPAIRRDGIAGLFYVSNWVQVGANSNYFDQYATPSIFRHLWSLAIEEQFYLVWPLVATLVLRRARRPVRTLAIVAAVGTVVSMGLAILLYHGPESLDRVYYGTDTRIGAILLGAFCACLVRRAEQHPTAARAGSNEDVVESGDAGRTGGGQLAFGRIPSRWVPWLAGASLVALLAIWSTLEGTSSLLWRGGMIVCGVLAATVISIVGSSHEGPVSRLLGNRVLVRFGIISYGLYLWHWPVRVVLTEARTGLTGVPLFVVRFAVSVAIAFASYYLVEWPIRRGALSGQLGRFRASGIAAVLTPLALVAVVLAGTTGGEDGHTVVPVAQLLGKPDHALPTVDPLLAPGTKPRILLMGDSVGHTVGEGIAALGASNGFESTNSAVEGCALVLEAGKYQFDGKWFPDPPGCTRILQLFDETVAAFKPNMVVFVYGRFWDPQRKFADGATLSPCDPKYDAWREATWVKILQHAKAAGIPVAVTTAGYYRGPLPAVGADRQTDCMNAATEAAAKKVGVRVADLGKWTCPTSTCVEYVGGHLLRIDGLHFDKAAEPIAAKWLLDDLLDGWTAPEQSASTTSTANVGG